MGLTIIIVLNPSYLYASKTEMGNYTVYHNRDFHPRMTRIVQETNEILKSSEFYDKNLQIDVCVNDGSYYPLIIRKLRGQAFGYGFYNKVVLQGTSHYQENFVELNGYKWDLTALLAHEITHCLQFEKLGFYKSNPIARIPNWKWEGYAEYISRKNNDQKELSKNIAKLQVTNKNSWEVKFSDNTITPKDYYEYWTLIQFCMDIKKMTYQDILMDTTSETMIKEEMMKWFSTHKPQ